MPVKQSVSWRDDLEEFPSVSNLVGLQQARAGRPQGLHAAGELESAAGFAKAEQLADPSADPSAAGGAGCRRLRPDVSQCLALRMGRRNAVLLVLARWQVSGLTFCVIGRALTEADPTPG